MVETNLLVTIAIFLLMQTGALIWLLATIVQAQKDHGYRMQRMEEAVFQPRRSYEQNGGS